MDIDLDSLWLVKFKCGENDFKVGNVYLNAGDDKKDFTERFNELTKLFEN